MEDGEKRHEIAPRGGGVVELLFAPGDERVVTREPTSGGKKTIVSIWEIAGTKLLETIKVPGWYSLAEYVADGSSLVLFDESSQRARARLWQKETGLLMPLSLGALDARYHTEEFYAGPNLRLAFADDEDHIKIWDAKDKKIVADFGAQPHRVRRIAVSPDGSRLASLDASGDVRIFDIASKKMLLEWPEHTLLRASEMAFDPKGAYLAITRQGWVEVLEIESGKWRAIYRRGDGWMQYDSEGKVRCEKEGCALVGFRTPKGEIVGHRDRRARKLRGLSKF
jgi:WD40 repeat protein